MIFLFLFLFLIFNFNFKQKKKLQEEGWVLEKKIGNGKTSEVYLGSDGKGFFKVF